MDSLDPAPQATGRRTAPPAPLGRRHFGQDSDPRRVSTHALRRGDCAAPSPPALGVAWPEPRPQPLRSIRPRPLLRELAQFRRRECVISRRQRRTPPSRAGDTLRFGCSRVARGEGLAGERGSPPLCPAMQVSSLNEVKIYSLSCGKSLPEVRHFGVPRLSRQPPLSSALASVLAWPWPAPGSGRPGGQVAVPAGAGRCRSSRTLLSPRQKLGGG